MKVIIYTWNVLFSHMMCPYSDLEQLQVVPQPDTSNVKKAESPNVPAPPPAPVPEVPKEVQKEEQAITELTAEQKEQKENFEIMAQTGWSENQVNAVRAVFKKFDKDGSGQIGKKELKACSHELGEDLDKEQLKELMSTWDEDGDGMIEFKEFVTMLTAG